MMNRIKEVRMAVGMTQADLALVSGISQAGISRMEGEDLSLTAESLLKIARGLNVSADYLLGLTDDPRPVRDGQPISLQEFALLDAYRKGDIKRVLQLLVNDAERAE
jgi:transcriptional regulator with XRE-family HTH domain